MDVTVFLQFGALGLLGLVLYGLGHGALLSGRWLASWLDDYKRDNREALAEMRATQSRLADTQDRLAEMIARTSEALTSHALGCREHGSILHQIDSRVEAVHGVICGGLTPEQVQKFNRKPKGGTV